MIPMSPFALALAALGLVMMLAPALIGLHRMERVLMDDAINATLRAEEAR